MSTLNSNNGHNFICSIGMKFITVCHRTLSWVLCCSLVCINDLPKIINNTSVLILFADDNSIIFTHHKNDSLNTNMHNTFQITNKRFKANLLSSNYAKTQCVQFRTKILCKLIARLHMVTI